MDEKELINLTLDFYKYKVNSDSCTMEELRQASSLGVSLSGEKPAYIMGDSVEELTRIICRLGCEECN